jgi:hypothetical protein
MGSILILDLLLIYGLINVMERQLIHIQNKIYEVRGQKIMLDFDLAEMYQVETKNLKRAVRRNIDRFPADFMFELTENEWDALRCQIGALNNQGRGQHPKYLPYAFAAQKLMDKPRRKIGYFTEKQRKNGEDIIE